MPELLLPRLKREIEARLAELRPAVAEAEHLEAAKRALLEERTLAAARRFPELRRPEPEPDPEPPATEPRRAVSAPPPQPAEPEAPAAARNPTREAILTLVEERPGVSVAEIVAVTKLPKPSVATTVSRLKREGLLADEAGGVKLASRTPLTLAQIAAAANRDGGVSDEEWEAASPQPGRSRSRS